MSNKVKREKETSQKESKDNVNIYASTVIKNLRKKEHLNKFVKETAKELSLRKINVKQ